MQDKTTIEGYDDLEEGQEISKNNATWFRIERIDAPKAPADDPFGDHLGEAKLVCVECTLNRFDEGEELVCNATDLNSANNWAYVREEDE